MNFKESYKKANDSIHGDKSILDGLYTPKKKIIAPYFYKMTSLAAAFILVGTVFLMSSFREEIKTENEKALTSVNKESTEEVGNLKIMARETTNLADEAKAEAGKNKKENVSDFADSPKTEKEYSTAYDEIPSEEDNTKEPLETAAETKVAEVTEVAEDEALGVETASEKVSSGGGGGSSAATFNAATTFSLSEEDMSTLEVLKLIGIPEEKLNFDNMELNLPDSIKVTFGEDGSLVSYVINFILSNGNAKIEGILINSVTPVPFEITEEEGVITAHKTFESTDIFIKAYNMDKETVKTFIESFS